MKKTPPFQKGDVVECDITCPGYHQIAGDLYIITDCFRTKGPQGWNWWVTVAETPISKLASDFHLAEIPA